MIVKHSAGSQKKKEPDLGVGYQPKQRVKNNKKVKKPASVKNQKKFSLEIHIDKLRGRQVARKKQNSQE